MSVSLFGALQGSLYLFPLCRSVYSPIWGVYTPAITAWILFYLAKVASPAEHQSTATLFWDIVIAAFLKSEIWVFHQ